MPNLIRFSESPKQRFKIHDESLILLEPVRIILNITESSNNGKTMFIRYGSNFSNLYYKYDLNLRLCDMSQNLLARDPNGIILKVRLN